MAWSAKCAVSQLSLSRNGKNLGFPTDIRNTDHWFFDVSHHLNPFGPDTCRHRLSTTWWRHGMKTFSMLLALCAGNLPVTGGFPSQRTVMRGFDVFLDLLLNKHISKQSWSWWFETPSHALWRHCNGPPAPSDQGCWTSIARPWYDGSVLCIFCTFSPIISTTTSTIFKRQYIGTPTLLFQINLYDTSPKETCFVQFKGLGYMKETETYPMICGESQPNSRVACRVASIYSSQLIDAYDLMGTDVNV